VVSPYSDLSAYRAISFFGWNTMDEKIYNNLSAYVEQGGILLICGCHFDVRVDPAAPVTLFRDGKVSDLIGCNICGGEPSKFGKIRNCLLENVAAIRLDEDLYVYQCGKGKVYFYSFLDIPSDPRLIKKTKATLKKIAEESLDENEVIIGGNDAQYINYNVWEQPDGTSVAYFTNVDWNDDRPKCIEVKYRKKTTTLRLGKAETVVMQF